MHLATILIGYFNQSVFTVWVEKLPRQADKKVLPNFAGKTANRRGHDEWMLWQEL